MLMTMPTKGLSLLLTTIGSGCATVLRALSFGTVDVVVAIVVSPDGARDFGLGT